MKFDVGTIGNHEFDEGVEEMNRLIYGGYHEKTGNLKEQNSHMLPQISIINPLVVYFTTIHYKKVQGVPVGFIGVVTTDVPNLVMPTMLKNVEITDEVEAINKSVKQLKTRR